MKEPFDVAVELLRTARGLVAGGRLIGSMEATAVVTLMEPLVHMGVRDKLLMWAERHPDFGTNPTTPDIALDEIRLEDFFTLPDIVVSALLSIVRTGDHFPGYLGALEAEAWGERPYVDRPESVCAAIDEWLRKGEEQGWIKPFVPGPEEDEAVDPAEGPAALGIQLGVDRRTGYVLLQFRSPVTAAGVDPDTARDLAVGLQRAAAEGDVIQASQSTIN